MWERAKDVQGRGTAGMERGIVHPCSSTSGTSQKPSVNIMQVQSPAPGSNWENWGLPDAFQLPMTRAT